MERIPESCADVQAALPLFVGSDLERDQLEAVAAHIAACAPCRATAGKTQAAREVLWTLNDEDAHAPDLWAGVREQLVAEGLLGKPGAPRGSADGPRPVPVAGPRRWQVGVVSAAAAIVLCFTLVKLLSSDASRVVAEPQLPTARVEAPAIKTFPVANRLHRAGPDEEHLMDSAVIFQPEGFHQGSVPTQNSLTGQRARRDPRVR